MRGLWAGDALVGAQVAAWTAVVLGGALGLTWVTGAVESVRLGTDGLVLALLRAPEAVLVLSPLLVALGSALAAARMEARGERVALQALGWSPGRSGAGALLVGLVFGLLGWLAADHLLHRAAAAAEHLDGKPESAWVWLDGAAVRVADGLRVSASGGRVGDVITLPPEALRGRELALARLAQRPRSASGEALRASRLLPARVERQTRAARMLASGAMALLGWLPWSRRPARQVATVLTVALAWQLADLVLAALAAQGRLPLAAALAAPALLALGIGLQLFGSRTRM